MAIIFSKSLSSSNLLNAYNNNIVQFSSNNVLQAVKCVITINTISFEITPIANSFKYNFKEVISVLINSSNFTDTILPSLSNALPSSHVYNDTSGTYLDVNVNYKIILSNDSEEQTNVTYKFLKSVEQLEQNKVGVVTGCGAIYVLSPFQKATNNTYNLTYFEGYPFDVSIYLKNIGTTTFLNETNGLSYVFNLTSNVNRVFFSDGRITITINDYLPLTDGLNRIKITRITDVVYLNVYKVPSKEGHYIKWLNQYGGWNYWLFNCVHKRTRGTKSIGFVNNDFNDVSSTVSSFLSLGKESQDLLTLVSEGMSEVEQDVLNDIFDSPKVYYFTGTRLTQVTNVSWLAVDLKSSSQTIKDFKTNYIKYILDFDLPQRYTMTL